MNSSLQILSTHDVLDHHYLHWQHLHAMRWHFPWQAPLWWAQLADRTSSSREFPDWAVISSVNQIIALLPLPLGFDRWALSRSLDFRPASGGGIVGVQVAAALNTLVRQFPGRRYERGSWDIHLDVADTYLFNRLDLALELGQMVHRRSTVGVEGWKLLGQCRAKLDQYSAPATLPSRGQVLWSQTGIPGVEISCLAELKSLVAERHPVRCLESPNLCILAWQVWLGPSIAIDRLPKRPSPYLLPWAIIGRDVTTTSQREWLSQQLLECLKAEGGNLLIPQSLADQLFPEAPSEFLTRWASAHRMDLQRWVSRTVSYRHQSFWDQIRRPARPRLSVVDMGN